MRAEPVANALGPVGFLATVWLGLLIGAPEAPLIWRGAAVGAGMWAAGWFAGRAGRAVLRDAAERIQARGEAEKKAAADAAAAARTGAAGAAPPATAARRT